ncbi:hypothetical protein [Pseudomonas graminis]
MLARHRPSHSRTAGRCDEKVLYVFCCQAAIAHPASKLKKQQKKNKKQTNPIETPFTGVNQTINKENANTGVWGMLTLSSLNRGNQMAFT